MRKRRTSSCAALRVLHAGPAGPQGPQKPRLRPPDRCFAFVCLLVPMRHGEWAGYNPKGAVMDDGVFVWHMDVPYENSRPARGPGARSAEGVPPGVCFFDSFFAQAKKECLRGERRHVRKRRCDPQGAIESKRHRGRCASQADQRGGLRCPSPQPLSRRERGSERRDYSSSRAHPSIPSTRASTSFTHTSNGTASNNPMIPHNHPNSISARIRISGDSAIRLPRMIGVTI